MKRLLPLGFLLLTIGSIALASEGFYELDQLPKKVLEPLKLDQKKIAEASRYVGLLQYVANQKLGADDIKKRQAWYCATSEARQLSGSYCEKIASKECESGCEFKIKRNRCSGVLLGSSFITSAHCLGQFSPTSEPSALIQFGSNGKAKPISLELGTQPAIDSERDLAVFRIGDPKRLPRLKRLKTAAPILQEGVFGIGMPVVGMRKDLATKTYSTTFGIRATFGKVMDPNTEAKAFCRYTNDDGPEVETWKLESTCTEPPKEKHRREIDPFLTDTDMTFGMSGSPLFNGKGELIGIGSNVLSATPESYAEDKYAIYVKATAIQKLEQSLK